MLPTLKGARSCADTMTTPCSDLSPEQRVPADHPLRAVRALTDEALQTMSRRFASLYATTGRPSIPPEQLLRALLLQVLYTVRSERLLMESSTTTCCSGGSSGEYGTRSGIPRRTGCCRANARCTPGRPGERTTSPWMGRSYGPPGFRCWTSDPPEEQSHGQLPQWSRCGRKGQGSQAGEDVLPTTGACRQWPKAVLFWRPAPPPDGRGGQGLRASSRFVAGRVQDVRRGAEGPRDRSTVTLTVSGNENSWNRSSWMKTSAVRHRGIALVDWDLRRHRL